MITRYKFNTTDSPKTKLTIDFTDETHFDIHARGRNFRDRNLIKKTILLKDQRQPVSFHKVQ